MRRLYRDLLVGLALLIALTGLILALVLALQPGKSSSSSLPSMSKLEEEQIRLEQRMNSTDLSDTSGSLAPEELGKLQTSQGWEAHPGRDCYEGAGGSPLSPDPYSTSLTPAQCRAVCGPGCAGIVTRTGQAGPGPCYRRSSLSLSSCASDPAWTTHVRRE